MSKIIYADSVQATQLAALKLLAAATKCKPARHNLEGFAGACYDMNTVEDLVEALQQRAADKTDCKNWNITPAQWRRAIKEALETKIFYAIEEIKA